MSTTELTKADSISDNTTDEVSAITADTLTAPKTDIEECENCHKPLNGPFCGNCGQEADSTLKYFWVVILHLLDDIFSFDSRASRTLFPLITRPAFLTNEYFAGRRVHYVPPLRLYLFISIVFFITLKFFVASENNNVLNINDKQGMVTQLETHIKKLETEEISLRKAPETVPVAEGDVADDGDVESEQKREKLLEEIAKFNGYLTDLNRDYSEGDNKKIIKVTRELVELEFEKATADLTDKEQERITKLLSKRDKILKGVETGVSKSDFTIGNTEDGSLRFDFLSDESNKKLEQFSKDFSEKAEKAFNSDTGPLVEQVISKLPQLMFILLPLFAALLKIMYAFSKRLYMEHLTVALHSHSFIFVALLLSEMLDVFVEYLNPTSPDIAGFVEAIASGLLVWIPIYLFLMQKRVYKQGKFFTLIKFSIIGTIYSVMIAVTGIVAVVWGIMGT